MRVTRALRVLGLLVLLPSLDAAAAQRPPGKGWCFPDGLQQSGAVYRICMPGEDKWNGDLVVWAHGFVAFNEPLEIPEGQLCGVLGNAPVCLDELTNDLGFAFATTSYATNGLAIVPGVEDVVELVEIFARKWNQPRRVYLVGASEGGLVTALAVERHPEVFDGGLSMCGPVGDFNLTTTYFGDFRVVFDYFFPGLLPGNATDVPPSLIAGWDDHWKDVVLPAMNDPANAARIRQLLRVTRAPHLKLDFDTVLTTIHDALWYSVFATGDAVAKLGGQSFDNVGKVYRGSRDDAALNMSVQRVAASPDALATIEQHYQTTGILDVPLVTLHTIKDQQIPYEHEVLYREKILDEGSGALHRNFKIRRYGHCAFNLGEALVAFGILVYDVTKQPVDGLNEILRDLEPAY